MSDEDRRRWDARYTDRPLPDDITVPDEFVPYTDRFPTTGRGLDLACGQGTFTVWLARRGVTMQGLDVSPEAIRRARDLAHRDGVADRCRFDVADLDDGLPPGDPVNVIVCYRFWDPALAWAIADRLVPGGILAMCALSTGRHGASADELRMTFPGLEIIGSGEVGGRSWMLAVRAGIRRPSGRSSSGPRRATPDADCGAD